MADTNIVKWIFGLLIYIMIATIVSWSYVGSLSAYGIDNQISYTSEINGVSFAQIISTGGVCEKYGLSETSPSGVYPNGFGNCHNTLGRFDNSTCSQIQGCTWSTEKNFLFVNYDTAPYCDGKVNASYYYNISGVATYKQTAQLYKAPLVVSNQQNCEMLGFKWVTASDFTQTQQTGTLWNAIKFMLGFSIDAGVPTQFSFIWSFFFVWLELISLIGLIIVLARG